MGLKVAPSLLLIACPAGNVQILLLHAVNPSVEARRWHPCHQRPQPHLHWVIVLFDLTLWEVLAALLLVGGEVAPSLLSIACPAGNVHALFWPSAASMPPRAKSAHTLSYPSLRFDLVRRSSRKIIMGIGICQNVYSDH